MHKMTEFKQCACGVGWINRKVFIRDADIQPIGMTFAPGVESSRLYYFFNHVPCQSTLAIDAAEFTDLIGEPISDHVEAGGDDCPKHCTVITDLEACSIECRNAPYRRFLINHVLKKKI